MNFKLTLVFIFIISISFAQNINQKRVDSLQSVLTKKNLSLKEEAHIYGLLADELKKLDCEKSMEYASKLYATSKKLQNKKGIADYYRISASNYATLGESEKAVKNAEESNKIYLQLRDTLNYLSNLNTISRSTNDLGDIEKATKIALKGIKLTKNEKFSYEIGDLYYTLCLLYNIKNDLEKSFYYVNQAEKNYEKSKNKQFGKLKCYQQLVQLFVKNDKYEKAIEYGLKSIAIGKEINTNEYTMCALYSSIGIAYFSNNQDEEAIKYLSKANDIFKNHGSKERRAFNLVLLSQPYFGLKQYDKAISISKEALAISENSHNIFMALGTIGNSYYGLGDYENALVYQIKAKDMIKEINDADHQRSIYLELSNTYHKLKDYKNAHEYLYQYQELEIDFLSKIQEKSINELEIKYDTKQKELDLKDLKIQSAEDKLVLEKLNNERMILWLIIVFGVIIISAIVLFVKKLSDKNDKLSRQNIVIEESKTRIELLLKELHHRTKNNLQLIISILQIQARNNKYIDINEFIEVNRNRINSMAMIHQYLYLNDVSSDKISLQRYLEDLIKAIKNTFDNNKNIDLVLQSHDIYCNLNTAIALGLIVNELSTNSLKYAFPNVEEGQITVTIEKLTDATFKLSYSDNGIGFELKDKSVSSFGIDLIHLLVSQLHGTIHFENREGGHYQIDFSEIDSHNH